MNRTLPLPRPERITPPRCLAKVVARLRACRSGLAMTEFALSLPLLFGVGLVGIETANLAITQMRISQLAAHIADNASRIGDTSSLQERKIYESDINDIFVGANIQARGLNIFEHGRVIVSSQEMTEDGNQYIHWQRCKGKKVFASSYGEEGKGESGGFPGMGPAGQEVLALEDDAVIFVEISYDYQSIIGGNFAYGDTLTAISSFNVRDSRDLSQIYQRDATIADPVAGCDTYDAANITVG